MIRHDLNSEFYGVMDNQGRMMIFENSGDHDMVGVWNAATGRLQFLSQNRHVPATDVGRVPWEGLVKRLWVVARCRNQERLALVRQAKAMAEGEALTRELFGHS